MNLFNYPFDDKVSAITTTREIGNVAFQVGNNSEEVKTNRQEIYSYLGIDKENLIFVRQSHSDKVKEVTYLDKGKGMDDFESGVDADALYTKEKGLAIGIFHADCLPILFYDPTIPLVGVIHAGHKGTLKHIAYKALSHIINKEHLDVNNLKICFGPYRHKENYYLDMDGFNEVIFAGLPLQNGQFDLSLCNRFDMICLGIPEHHIYDINVDTCTNDNCYSAYNKKPVGRMASIIHLKEEK